MSKDFEIIFDVFSIWVFSDFLSNVEINPKCLDCIFSNGFFWMIPTIGILVCFNASLHKISCFLLPILLRIIPEIREFL